MQITKFARTMTRPHEDRSEAAITLGSEHSFHVANGAPSPASVAPDAHLRLWPMTGAAWECSHVASMLAVHPRHRPVHHMESKLDTSCSAATHQKRS